MREPVEVRRQRILAAVEARGRARVADLAAELDVSVVTVRRDVEELARAGRLARGHGVARSLAPVAEARAVGEAPDEGRTVAVVVPQRHSYLFETLNGARQVLEASGTRIALHIAPQGPDTERAMTESALAGGARGVLIAPRWRSLAAERADYAWLAELPVPTVLMERRPAPGSPLHARDSVCSDHWYGVHLAVEHLVSRGHRRIVLAARDDSPTARAVRAAFAEITTARPEVEHAVVALSSPLAVPDPADESDSGQLDLAALLREHRATAAVLHGDEDALIHVQRLAEAGVRVPEDCSVIAYDDVVAGLGSTPLTAVAPPKARIGAAAAQLLLDRLEEAVSGTLGPVRRTELLPELKVRGSVRELPRGK